MKKILFVASVYRHLVAFHKPFMKLLQEKGYEIHAAGSPGGKRKEELEQFNVVCHDVEFDRLPFSKKNVRALKSLRSLFEAHYFDLIHVHTPTAAFLTRYAASKAEQGRILYTAHGFHFYKGAPQKNWLLFYTAEKIARQWTSGLLVMNDEDYELGKKIGFKENKDLFYVHGVGVDLHEFHKGAAEVSKIKKELKLDQEAVIISCVAELSKRKNQIFLLKNWKSVVEICPNAHLLLIGNGEDKEEINSFVKKQNLSNVHLLGFRRDVPSIIASSDIITLVSKHEGLPRCLMEAMACGKPIITTNVRGSRDLVVDQQNGIVLELEDNDGLSKSFIKLIQDTPLRKKYGKAGQEKIQKYSLTNVIDEMDQVYCEYLQVQRGREFY